MHNEATKSGCGFCSFSVLHYMLNFNFSCAHAVLLCYDLFLHDPV